MKDHDARKGLGGVDGCSVVADLIDRLHDGSRVVADDFLVTEVLVGPVHAISYEFRRIGNGSPYSTGATSRTQWPNVPKVTDELRISLLLVSITFKIAISPMTGAEIVVIRRSIADANSRKVPTWWKIPVLAILKTLMVLMLVLMSLYEVVCS